MAWFSKELLQDPGLPWVAVRTRARSEKMVAKVLTSWGCDAWAPTAPVRRRWSDRWKVIEWALFPGYVFARVPVDGWYPLLDVHGVQTVVKDGRRAATLAPQALSDIRAYAARLGHVDAAPEHVHWFDVGDLVMVADGPFAGIRAQVIRVDGLQRVAIGVPLLGRGVAVTIPVADLVRIPA